MEAFATAHLLGVIMLAAFICGLEFARRNKRGWFEE